MKFMALALALAATPCAAQTTPAATGGTARATIAEPSGWTIDKAPTRIRLTAPENDLAIELVDVDDAADAGAAAIAAWHIVDPAFSRAVTGTSQDAPGEGWDEVWQVDYVTVPDEKLVVRATALRRDGRWTVMLIKGGIATLQKRSGTVLAITESLRPAGFVAEDFTGRPALPFNAARRAQLKAFWRRAMVAYQVPGIGYAFFDRHGIIEEGGVGVRRAGAAARVTAHTRFRIASNTKGMTTLMMARLVDQGKLSWDEPVTQADPAFRLGDPATLAAIKVRHLVCACTGLPRQDLEWLLGSTAAMPASRDYDLLAPMKPTSKFGEVYQYSNLLAAAGGYVAGHAAYPLLERGAAYDRAMQELVFTPLGMRDTTLDTRVALAGDHAWPHDVTLTGVVGAGRPDAGDSINFARPAGGAWSSAHDVALYAFNELTEGVLPSGKRLVSRDALLERRRGGVEYGEATRYGMGVETIKRWGVTIIHHGGALPGWGTDWFVLPDAGIGVVLLMNSESGRDIEEATRRRLVELLYGARPRAEASVRAGGVSLRNDIRDGVKDIAAPPDPAAVGRLAAVYTNPALGRLTVSRDVGGVTFHFPATSSRVGSLKNRDGSHSFMMIDPATGGWTLLARPAGKYDALVIRQGQSEYVYLPLE